MIIDFHTHIFNDALAPRALATMLEQSHYEYHNIHDLTHKGLIAKMDEFGVDKSVILNVPTKRKQVEVINEWAIALRSDRIEPFAGIFPDSDDYKEQIDDVCSLGFKGIKLHAEYQNFVLDEPRMLRLYDYAFSKGLIIVHHAGFDPAFAGPFKTSPKQFAHVLDEMKGGRLVAAHMGGIKQWAETEEYLCGRDIYLDTSMGFNYYTPETFDRLTSLHRKDRFLFGSDSPWSDTGNEIKCIKASKLTKEEQDMLFYKNALELLGGSD